MQPAPPPKAKVWGERGPLVPEPGVVDPVPMQRLVTEDAYIRQGLATILNIKYGEHQIGPSGSISNGSAER